MLDLTRSLRRAGRVATGVDRVERAYLAHMRADDVPLFGLVRTALGYVLLNDAGLTAFQAMLEGRAPWGAVDVMSRLPRGRTRAQQRSESAARRLACARATRGRLGKMLMRHVPEGFAYYNVGHSNLTDRVLGTVKAVQGDVHVLVHDVIPLEHPEFQRPGSVAPFRAKMQRVAQRADRVIYNSADTQRRAEAQMRAWGPVPPGIVAHLGTIMPVPNAGELPAGVPPQHPYFVSVGTLEPRKNHAFLLDLWEEMGPDAPPLFLCGSRGWANEAVFARLDALPPDHPIKELPGLSDPALAALVQGAVGTLFPSHAEGFGLPPMEALHLGARVLCNDLTVFGESLGNKAVYADVSDRYLWISTIQKWSQNPPERGTGETFVGPTWADHFKIVLTLN